jgi:hypothetical protein
MRRIIYRSTASPGLDRVEMFRLVYQARVSNESRGLGGFLIRIDGRLFRSSRARHGNSVPLSGISDAIRAISTWK